MDTPVYDANRQVHISGTLNRFFTIWKYREESYYKSIISSLCIPFGYAYKFIQISDSEKEFIKINKLSTIKPFLSVNRVNPKHRLMPEIPVKIISNGRPGGLTLKIFTEDTIEIFLYSLEDGTCSNIVSDDFKLIMSHSYESYFKRIYPYDPIKEILYEA